jgi:hypothetical protein
VPSRKFNGYAQLLSGAVALWIAVCILYDKQENTNAKAAEITQLFIELHDSPKQSKEIFTFLCENATFDPLNFKACD